MNSARWFLAYTLLCSLTLDVAAYDYERQFDAAQPNTWPVIAIIIDDLGNGREEGNRAIELPGPVAYAILPHTPFGPSFARKANDLGKEVLLHQPLQATHRNHLLGDGAITIDHTQEDVLRTLRGNLDTVPFAVGVNNHMGSLLTQRTGHMRWLMQAISQSPLYFVDSVTSGRSVAQSVAAEVGVPTARRDVFLDSDPSYEAVAQQFERLKQHARRHGFALGIGHPFPHTLSVLERELPRLAGLGYRFVSVQRMIELQGHPLSEPLSIREESP
ncbi:MAG: divergent polysaccharide deacetylase family protein [Pseudomonadota bacterium]